MILACIVGSVSSRFNYVGFSFKLFVNADRYNILAHVGTKAKIFESTYYFAETVSVICMFQTEDERRRREAGVKQSMEIRPGLCMWVGGYGIWNYLANQGT